MWLYPFSFIPGARAPEKPAPIAVFIHGAFVTPACWNDFRQPFDAAGFRCLAPAWPGFDRSVETLRREPPDSPLGSLSLQEITDHYARIIATLDAPPLLVGHSIGGLVVQMLLARGLGAAGVALAPAPFAGLLPDPVSLSAALQVGMGWRGWHRTYEIERSLFDTLVANTIPPERRAELFSMTVPSPGRLYGEAATGTGTFLWTPARRSPLLMVAGSEDRLVSPALVQSAWLCQKFAPGPAEFYLQDGACHLLICGKTGQDLATRVTGWALAHGIAGGELREG